jgi:amino acid transporter/nucleotide-binding universal stress UspA family protein
MDVRLSREMRLIDVTMIGVGAMIGAGIFVLTGIAAGVAGPALLLVFLLNGVVALLTAMAYAELGGAVHGAGGGYLYVKASLPDPSGFLAGLMSWFAHAVACSLYALGFGAYLKEVLSFAGLQAPTLPLLPFEVWAAILACGAFAYINFRGASETGKAGNIVTIGKVTIIGVFIAAGLWAMAHRPGWHGAFTPFMTHGWAGVLGAMGLTFIAFEGYEIIAQTSEEVENPKRNVPRAVFLAILIVIPIYLLVALVSIGAVVPPPGMEVTDYLGQAKEIALVNAADQFMVGGGILILVGGLLSTLSALNATIYSSSRVALAMARDGSLPEKLAAVHPVRGTPHWAVAVSTILIVLMAVALPIEDVAAAAGMTFLFLFGGVNIALIRLRTQRPDLDRGFRVPWVPFTPLVAIAAMLLIAAFMLIDYPLAWLASGGWIAVGGLYHYAYGRKREAQFIERVRWMERLERRDYRVLVALGNSARARHLIDAAAPIARVHGGSLVLLTVVEVPEGQPLAAGRAHLGPAERLLESAVTYASERGVAATPILRIAHRISRGITETAREEGCNFLLLGQPVGHSFLDRVVASIVDRVLLRAPCHVGVLYGAVNPTAIRRILVPLTGSANSRLAAELAVAFRDGFEAPVQAVTVVERGTRRPEAEAMVLAARATAEAGSLPPDVQVLHRRDTARGLAAAAQPSDLVVIGGPSAGPTLPLFGETVPTTITRRGQSPVLVVRAVEPRRAGRFERAFFGRR